MATIMVNTSDNVSVLGITHDFAAEIRGVDLSKPISEAAFEKIVDAFHRYSVLYFRNQDLSAQQLARFSERFGELDVHHMTEHTVPGLPQVRVMSNERREDGTTRGITRGGMHWHSDLSYKPVPALVTMLYGVECPPAGADTQFANMAAAYDALPEATRRLLDGKRIVHDRNFRYNELYPQRPALTPDQIGKVPPTEHPLVRLHPQTRRRCLYVAKDVCSHIVGMDFDESRELIDELEAFATRPRFLYSHKWRTGDLLMWDNRSTIHRATPFDFDRHVRSMLRTQVKGEVPLPA